MDKTQVQKNTNLSTQAHNADYVFYFKKTEKICSALYLVTSYFDREEPMKWRIRQKANELHTAVTHLKDVSDAALSERKRIIREEADEIISLLWVARTSGLISAMNADVCTSELRYLVDGVGASNGFEGLGDQPVHELFAAGDEKAPAELKQATKGGATAPRTTSQTASTAPDPEKTEKTRSSHENAKNGEHTAHSPKPAVQAKKSKRQNAILRLLSEHDRISVKDAANVVTNCSDKTLQRELQSLVNEGVLKKEGSRRWTRYSFA